VVRLRILEALQNWAIVKAIAMSDAITPTRSMKFTEPRPHLSELLNRVFGRKMRIRITKGNIPVAAIVSIGDLERLERLDAQRDADFQVFRKMSAAFADQSPEEIEEHVNLAVAEVRAEMRRERLLGAAR